MKPTLEIRLKQRERPPHRTPVLHEQWQDLLFLHWEVDPQAIQQTLPTGLYVDTLEDKAYLGIVPFVMQDIRPHRLPAFLGVSGFLELNVRTYVYDRHGTPGVWFYSLDASQYFAVKLARLFFNLPYFYASMAARSNPENKEISYSAYRHGTDSNLKTYFRYRPMSDNHLAVPGSLEFFLIERYVLFSCSQRNKLYSGRVWHTPYPLASVEVIDLDENVLCLDGFPRPSRPADHMIVSAGVDVEVFGLDALS